MKRKKLNKGGDCYEVAMKYVWQHEDEEHELFVVHGIVGGFEFQGEYVARHGHAWVEYCERKPLPESMMKNLPEGHFPYVEMWYCIDKSNGKDAELPRELYYYYGHVNEAEIKMFSVDETRKMCLKHKHYGPWNEIIYDVEKEEGVGTLPENKKRRGRPRISERTKEKAKMMLEGSDRSMADVARRVGVSEGTIGRWVKEWGFRKW